MQKLSILLFLFCFSGNVLADISAAAQAALDAQDYPAAIRLLEADVNRNLVEASYQLGILYRDGLGVKRDPVAALRWFEESADVDWMRAEGKFGYPDAQYQAGLMYRDGVGTERDPEEAADYFEQAANQGHAAAQAALAGMLLRGEGVDRDYQEAYIWASLAVEQLSDKAEEQAATTVRDEAARHLSPAELITADQEIADRRS